MSKVTDEEVLEHIESQRKQGVKFREIAEELAAFEFALPDGGSLTAQAVERFYTTRRPGWGNQALIERLKELYLTKAKPARIAKVIEAEGYRNPRGLPIGVSAIKTWRVRLAPELAHTRYKNTRAGLRQSSVAPEQPQRQLEIGAWAAGQVHSTGLVLAAKILQVPGLTDSERISIIKGILG